jgi:pSer/pThr/pTyr-binding forkhead associated (FHA) protein
MEGGALTTMLIRLEHNGRIVHEISSSAISGEIVIGRGHACSWPVPKEDSVCSSRHAALFLKGRQVWLKDLGSTNGTFHNGKRIAKKKLAVGDKIGIGNCLLSAEPERGGDSKVFSELHVLSGKARGQKKRLAPPVFTVGSDPSANLVFLDMLVSRRHAEILVKEDGSCWIRDLGSKNGTSVNGMPLRDDKERLLKDGDRIAFSHFEAEFHDGAVARSNKQVWLRIGILAATLAAGLGAYGAYQRMRPSAESFIREARRLAAGEAFAEAAQAVERAATARGAASNQVTIEELRRLLGVWQNTVTVWGRAQRALKEGKWTQVSRDLGMLQAVKKDAWEWNEAASVEKENMANAKTMLDAFLRAEASVGRESLSFAELADAHRGVEQALARLGGEPPAYLALLKADLERISVRQAALLGEGRKLEQALDLLGQQAPPYGEVAGVIARTAAGQEGAFKRRAQTLEPAVRALAESDVLLNAAAQQVRGLEIAKALAADIKLPSTDVCALDPRVSHARLTIEQIHANLKVKAGQLSTLFAEVEKRVGREGDFPESFRLFADAALVKPALACDALEKPLPKRSRTAPLGAYDQLLGVEEFFTYLSAFPEPADPALVSDLPFVSVLTRIREAAQKIEALLAFLRQPDNQWLMGDTLRAQAERLDAILARRDALAKEMTALAEADASRAGLIAGGIVARLATQPGQARIKGLKPEEWVAAELKRQRAALLRLNGEYALAPPARQIAIRTEILAGGLPGDPVVRRMWAFRDAAAGSAAKPPP